MRGTIKRKLTLVLAVGLLALIGNSFVFADGEGRAATPQEKAYYKRVMSVFDQAVPEGPAGWRLVHRSQVDELQYVGIGSEKIPFLVGYVIIWEDEARINAAVAAGQQEVSDKHLDEVGVQEEQLIERLEQLANQLTEAMEKGEKAEVAKIQAEIDKINAKMGSTQNARENEEIEIASKNSPHDVKLNVCLNVNNFEALLDHSAKKETSIAGGLVMRTDSCIDGYYHTWTEGSTYVFLGNDWRVAKDGESWRVTSNSDSKLPHTTVQTIVVSVQGDPVRARNYLERIDWNVLKGLLKK